MSKTLQKDRILILDFGSQYAQLIARRVREIGVYCELLPYDVAPARITEFAPKGVILSGGPETVITDDAPKIPQAIFELEVPILGICYGMQALAAQLGGEVSASTKREFGHADLHLLKEVALFSGVAVKDEALSVWMSHGDKVTSLPEGFISLAKTSSAPYAAMANLSHGWYGVQFHPEVTHTNNGDLLLRNFLIQVCRCDTLWNSEAIIEDLVLDIQAKVKDDNVLLALSGGVDSAVVAVLLKRAIGDQLHCVFVDNGLLRLGEADEVRQTFAEDLGINLICVDAAESFLSKLAGVTDPEQKRKIIGTTFIEVFDAESEKLEGIKWLAQGTIYPDVIESAGTASGKAHVIKSHHNVGGLPERMQLQLLEPLRDLFKDEVRKLGIRLGLQHGSVYRHPFPGPGLAVRVLGEVKPEYCDILRQADAIFIEELRAHDLYEQVSQAFVVFLPVKSVGVVGDARQYEYVVAVRAVETLDFMTARWARLPYPFLERVSSRIINEVKGISRVTYDISSKPPATIEWE